VLIWRDPL